MNERPGISRRQALISGGLVATVPLLPATRHLPSLVRSPDAAGAPPPEQLHVQFGADAATQIAVSWAAADAVARPRVRVGHSRGEFGFEVSAEERVYTEALTGERVYTYHARLNRLAPDTAYVYEVLHDGAGPVPGTFRTGPRGRSKGFRFTSFGDQSVPAAVGQGLGPHTPNAGYIVDAVDALDPLLFMPLFDAYGVDLVVAGHEHHFERTFPVRGSYQAAPCSPPRRRAATRPRWIPAKAPST